MKKLTALFIALSIGICACGCDNSQKPQNSTSQTSSQTDSEGIFDLSSNDILMSMREKVVTFPSYTTVSSHDENGVEIDGWKDSFSVLYDNFPQDNVLQFSIAYSNETTSDELTVVILKDKKDTDTLKSQMQAYVNSRIDQFEVYGPEEVPKLKSAKIISKENIVALIVCDDPNGASEGFKEALN